MKILKRLTLFLVLLVVLMLIIDVNEEMPQYSISKLFIYYGIPEYILYSAALLLIVGLYILFRKKTSENQMILDFQEKTWFQKLDFEPSVSGFLLGFILVQCILAASAALIAAGFRYFFL
jgi:hypothetical protein